MILVTGVNGQLGYDVVKELQKRQILCKGIDIDDLDITNKNEVHKFITDLKPDAVIHCAAYTAVDRAEDEQEKCELVNVTGTENIAAACKEINAKMMYFSTDYVFSGSENGEYEIDDEKSPQSVYGKTKYLGELKVVSTIDKYFILRISWVFGINGSNFIKTMIKLSKSNSEVSVVCDQIGSPTYTADLALLICDMIITEKYGVYHATNEGYCSWSEFAKEIFSQLKADCKVREIPSTEYPSKAMRPLNSRLSKDSLDKAGFKRLPDWHNALERYLSELK